jgi:hypothetical protein
MSSKKSEAGDGNKDGYTTEIDYYHYVAPMAEERASEIEAELFAAFKGYFVSNESRLIDINSLTPERFAEILIRHPKLLKPFSVLAVVAMRAFEKDLGIRNVNTYKPHLNEQQALKISKYLLEQMPKRFYLETIRELDRNQFIDKEKRKLKGSWENGIIETLVERTGLKFTKTRIIVVGEEYEIDAAHFEGQHLKYAIDIKKIGSRRDFQKRSDEIINKSVAYRKLYPDGKFAAVVHYPFEKDALRSRLKSNFIDMVVFANDSPESITEAVKTLIEDLPIQLAARQSHIS